MPGRAVEVRIARARSGGDVRLLEAPTVHPQVALLVLADRLAGKADQPLDVHARLAAGGCRLRGGVEDHDLLALRPREAVADLAGDHPVGEARLAPGRRMGAMEGGLHRRGGARVGLGDLRLEGEHERDRDEDRDQPVDHRTPWAREPASRAIEQGHPKTVPRAHHLSTGISRPDMATTGRQRQAGLSPLPAVANWTEESRLQVIRSSSPVPAGRVPVSDTGTQPGTACLGRPEVQVPGSRWRPTSQVQSSTTLPSGSST